jgi:hypothetical protein
MMIQTGEHDNAIVRLGRASRAGSHQAEASQFDGRSRVFAGRAILTENRIPLFLIAL